MRTLRTALRSKPSAGFRTLGSLQQQQQQRTSDRPAAAAAAVTATATTSRRRTAVAADDAPAAACEFEFLLRTGGRQHTARGDAAEDFDEMQPARVLAAKGKDHQALAAYERVVAQRHDDPCRGPHHPETLRAHVSLGNYQRATGRTGAAADSYRAALDGRVATLGPRHVDTLAVRFTLAGLLKDLAELEPALKEYEATVAGYVETLGERHTATLDAMYGLAILLQQQQALSGSGGGAVQKPAQLTGMAKILADKEARERNAAAKRQHEAGVASGGCVGEEEEDRVTTLYETVVAGYAAQLGPRHTGPSPCIRDCLLRGAARRLPVLRISVCLSLSLSLSLLESSACVVAWSLLLNGCACVLVALQKPCGRNTIWRYA